LNTLDNYVTKKWSNEQKDSQILPPEKKKLKPSSSTSKPPAQDDMIIPMGDVKPTIKRKTYDGRDIAAFPPINNSPKTEEAQLVSPKLSQTQKRNFDWLKKFHWLEYNVEKDLMF